METIEIGINELAKLNDLIDAHGLWLVIYQDGRGYRIESKRGRAITPILSGKETYLHLTTILNTLNALNLGG